MSPQQISSAQVPEEPTTSTAQPVWCSLCPGRALVASVRAETRPEGTVEVFAHGERTAMKELRAVLQDDWGLERRSLSLSAYWALGRAEDRFQAEKREPVGAIFAD